MHVTKHEYTAGSDRTRKDLATQHKEAKAWYQAQTLYILRRQ